MYKKILVALSLDHGISERALRTARKLLDEGGTIEALHVIEQIPEYAHQQLKEGQDEVNYNRAMDGLKERIGEAADVKATVLVGHAGRAIPEHAEKVGSDCIVIGSHEPSLADFFLGSTAERIVRHAKSSVHVIR
ncbi:universal stress protein [Terasakiella sp. A23]|uniref:universal stress protein n=1 Tax=Terasakiella sp. FCG-A23 TaxID=3080561 RepID=UPI002955BE3E|nr:universal stress protein [Terasakiella sp. A23]MDV7341476.1 universal stress protein [Terasakiella sp. A23]